MLWAETEVELRLDAAIGAAAQTAMQVAEAAAVSREGTDGALDSVQQAYAKVEVLLNAAIGLRTAAQQVVEAAKASRSAAEMAQAAAEARVGAAEALSSAMECARTNAESAQSVAEARASAAESAREKAEADMSVLEAREAAAEAREAAAEARASAAESARAKAESAQSAAEARACSAESAQDKAEQEQRAAVARAATADFRASAAETARQKAVSAQSAAEARAVAAESAQKEAESASSAMEAREAAAQAHASAAASARERAESAQSAAEARASASELARTASESARSAMAALAADAAAQVLRLQSELQRQAGRFGHHWQYQDGDRWLNFASEANAKLSRACGESEVQVGAGSHTYTIVLGGLDECPKEMHQVNSNTGKRRPIRCNFELPQEWARPNEHWLKLLRMGSLSALTFGEVCVKVEDASQLVKFQSLLVQTCVHDGALAAGAAPCSNSFEVSRMIRIENPTLWARYRQCKEVLRGKIGGQALDDAPVKFVGPELRAASSEAALDLGINEFYLLHGTTQVSMERIAAEGFDYRVNKQDFFGRGTYFASQACKSRQYAGKGGVILVCRVALGDPHVATRVQSFGRPPDKPSGARFDSVVAHPGPMEGHPLGGKQTHAEFVIFEQFQAYPEFALFV